MHEGGEWVGLRGGQRTLLESTAVNHQVVDSSMRGATRDPQRDHTPRRSSRASHAQSGRGWGVAQLPCAVLRQHMGGARGWGLGKGQASAQGAAAGAWVELLNVNFHP